MKKKANRGGGYRVPLWKLIWYANTDILVLCLIIVVLFVGVIVLFQRQRFWEYFALVPVMLVFFPALLVGVPATKTLYRLRLQERILQLRFKDRDDQDKPEERQAWFMATIGNEILLLNRNFVEKVTRIFVDKEGVTGTDAKFYAVEFVACDGKKRKVRLEHMKSEKDRFTAWLAGPPVETEEDEDDIYLDEEDAEV